ncbi:MAG TPA: class I SAM-dependent methyltransferase [Ktedonobacteraceae bacterium]
MALPIHPRREKVSTYIVQDRSNQEELKRLELQERMMLDAQGGLVPEHPDPTSLQHVLDVACGTGGWLIEMARTYPTIPQLVGVDISRRTIEYARAQAEAEKVSGRVEFYVMDALQELEFPRDSFDLVNLRFATGFLRFWEWSKLLQEFHHLLQPGGMARLTEADLPEQSSSQALLTLLHLLARAFHEAGHYFRPDATGVANELAGLLERHGFQQTQVRIYAPEANAETVVGQIFIEDMKYLFRTVSPFIHKWTRVPDDYESLYHRMVREIQQPDFRVDGQGVTAWGFKS